MALVRRFWMLFPALLLLAGVLVMFYWQRPSTEDKKKPERKGLIRLVYWGVTEPADAISVLIEAYERDHPGIRIDYRRQTRDQYLAKLRARLAQGGGGAPDLFQWHNTWMPLIGDALAPAPAEVLTPDTLRASFYQRIFHDVTRGSQVVGVPVMLDGLVLIVNETLLNKAGFEHPPTSWEEFRRMARALTTYDDNGNIVIAGAAIGTSTNVDHWSDLLAVMMFQSGGDPGNPTDTRAAEVVDFYTLFVTEDHVWDDRMSPSLVAFANGQAAMAFTPASRLAEIMRTNPLLRMRTAPLPQLPESQVAWASYWIEGVNTGSLYKKEAWEFLTFLSSVDSIYRLASEHTKILGVGFPYPRPVMARSLADDPLLAAFGRQAAIMEAYPMAYGTKDEALNDGIIAAYDTAVRSVLAGRDVGSALAAAAEEIARIRAQY